MVEKLVRDKIPEIIGNEGKVPQFRTLADEEYDIELGKKLLEEVNEYLYDKTVEELADILEVIRAIAVAKGIDYNQIESVRKRKFHERGGFSQRIFLTL